MGVAPPGLGQDARERLLPPALDLLVVALGGPVLGLLGASVEALFEDLADVLGVVGEAEVAADDRGDALGRPQLGGPAVGAGAVQQQVFEVLQLVVAQARGRARVGLGGQAVGMRAGGLAPAVEGGAGDAQDAGDGGRGLAAVHEFDRMAATAFQFGGSSNRSAHTELEAAGQ